MTAFRQVVRKLQDGQREEAMIGLEFVLRLDPDFRPALNLQQQLSSGASEIDLSSIITDLQAPTTDAIEGLLIEAVEDFERRNFVGAKDKVEKVLLELPGHGEARQLLAQITQALKVETQVGQFLTQAREALDQGDPQEAANFVMMAQALDPHHAGIQATLQDIYAVSGATASVPETPVADAADMAPDEAFPSNAFAVSFEESAEPAAGPPGFGASSSPATPGFGSSPEGFDQAPPSGGFDLDTAPDRDRPSAPSDDWGGFSSSDFSFGTDASQAASGDLSFDGGDADLFDASPADVSDLFDAGPESPSDEPGPGASAHSPEVEAALREGDAAFNEQRFLDAMHAWSRGLLSDPENADLGSRIGGARITVSDLRQRFEETLANARSAAESGDRSRALELIAEIHAIEPGHIGAALLHERLELPVAAPVAPPTTVASGSAPGAPLPSLEDDLFSEEFGLASTADDQDGALLDELAQPATRAGTRPAEGRRPPWFLVAIGAAALLVVLAGVWVGVRILGSAGEEADDDPTAINQALQEAQALFDQRRTEEAIQLLQSFPATGLQRERLDRRIATYQESLAPPTPTPIPDGLIRGRELFESGRFLSAYQVVQRSLEAAPQDPGLLELHERIVAVEPLARSLHTALASGNFRVAVGAADAYLQRHPTAPDGVEALERSLFNAALAELRSYNLTGADVHLQRLAKLRPDDVEVQRVLMFIERYKASPVDMQFQTFTRSLTDR